MRILISLFLCLWVVVLAVASPAGAQGTIANPSFEDGLSGWLTYTYEPYPDTIGAEPTAGCSGSTGCPFDLLDPGPAPDGSSVCGIQSTGTNGNGGICQTFDWPGGPVLITVSGRCYSKDYSGEPFNNGSLVRMGLVEGYSENRLDVTEWVNFPWSDQWSTQQLSVPGPGSYTIFIEACQPDSDAVMSTIWDKVQLGAPVTITNGPDITPDPLHPETAAIITWTTDVPSTSRVDYGSTTGYGRRITSDEQTTFHTLTMTGLTRSNSYHCSVTSTLGDFAASSSDQQFTTPIQMSNLTVTVSEDHLSATLTWQTDIMTDAQVEYWPTPGSHQTVVEALPNTNHQVTLDLVDGKEYHFRATSRAALPYTSVSASGKFYTLPAPGNSLANCCFEDTLGGGEHSLYPWVQYTTDVGVVSPSPIDGLVGPYPSSADPWLMGIHAYDGSYFLGTQANWYNKNGGAFQRVNVTPGYYYVLSARYLTYRSGGEDGYDIVRLGIDPNGGIDASSPNVQWWTGFSDTNDNRWHIAAVSGVGSPTGVATIFLDFQQKLSIQWQIAAIDKVSFLPPQSFSIGALKSTQSNLGAILVDKTVTYVSPSPAWYGKTQYIKAYIEEDNRSSGIAVLFPLNAPQYPVAGDKLTVTGTLGEYKKEAAVMANIWSVDRGSLDIETGDPQGYALPKPFALNQAMIGTKAENQPPMFSHNIGLCTLGLRVRLCGRVTWASPEGVPGDAVAYVDDGGGIADASGHTGIRVLLPGKSATGVSVGDYVAVTGVLGTDFIDPNNWPDPTTDFYTFRLFVNDSDDWSLIPGSGS